MSSSASLYFSPQSATRQAVGQILINGRFLSRTPTGVDRFAYEVLAGIDQLLEADDPCVQGLRFKLLLPPGVTQKKAFTAIETATVGEKNGQLWEQFDLPRAVGRGDLLLNLCNTAPAFLRRQIVVIHDATTVRYPVAFSRSFRNWYRILMPILGRSARRVLTVSDFSKNEIARAFHIPTRKCEVVIEGGEHILRTSASVDAVHRFGLDKRPFVLAVSSLAAHKNFKLVLEALALMPNPPFDVAIAGGANSRVFGAMGDLGSDKVRWLGYVEDDELRALYEHALCFVFPSLYEGFGIPPLEAMVCGCPVLAANAASIPEVCGDAALYFDPRNPTALATLLQKISSDESLREDLCRRGRQRAQLFSWDTAARQVVQACRENLV
ncbi:MAG TPA: glycosyltransferase family 1 protein [Burkholderiales bacterium]|nr:glycosyltransferase family 1 protein [Burkholderiales bacterium]